MSQLDQIEKSRRSIKYTPEDLKTHENSINSLQVFQRRFDPVWSPDSQWMVSWVWRNGVIDLEICNAISGTTKFLPTLQGTPMSKPVWSFDSNYLAWASRDEIKIYDLKNKRTDTFKFEDLLPAKMGFEKDDIESRTAIGLYFENWADHPIFHFCFDQMQYIFGDGRRAYLVFSNELKEKDCLLAEVVREKDYLPDWAKNTLKNSAIDFKRREAKSPDKKKVAKFMQKDSLDELKISRH